MILLPAIDLMDGQVVRLQQGKADQKTVYSNDPVAFAKKWEQQGGDYLHLVDLNAAFSGVSTNLPIVKEIAAAISIPCELGGGIRSLEAAENALNAGVSRIVIGTRAAESIDFVRDLVKTFGSEKIAVGIDAKNGLVSTKGWTELSSLTAHDLARQVSDAGAGTIIYTDIATDGMLQGPNFAELEKLLSFLELNLIASGGVSSEADVRKLATLPNLYGAIIGKALYDNKLDLESLRDLPRNSGMR